MPNLGSLSLICAFTFSIYAIAASLIGGHRREEALVRSAENAACAVFFAVTLAVLSFETLLLQGDYSYKAVWATSNLAMSWFYKMAALWGGQEGSLLFWSWILNGYVLFTLLLNRRKNRSLMPYVVSILSMVSLFFLVLNLFLANPFTRHAIVRGAGAVEILYPPDGHGLNPLLQHPAMVIHPPILYTGYVGFVVPFAFAIAALMRKETGELWIKTTRRATLVSWLFLGAGILLGARWAYVELGWGGYWGWDPVENASLMPWLTATAFLHSVMIQEKRRMLKVWNMVLIILTFVLCLFGTFLTRSGMVSSVHAFAQSSIGPAFAVFITMMLLVSFGLLLVHLKYLKSANAFDSVISRESSFLFNNLVLLAAMFAILWGTLLPVISEAFEGEKITVGPPFFNRVTVPIGLVILFLTGVGPLIAWRKNSLGTLKRNLTLPSLGLAGTAVTLFIAGVRKIYPIVSFSLSVFVVSAIVSEFYRGARARQRSLGESFLKGLYQMMMRNKRRYGGYVVHLAVVLLFVGFTGNAFTKDAQAKMKVGDRLQIRGYEIVAEEKIAIDNDNYEGGAVRLGIFQNRRRIATLYPERRFYKSSEQTTTEVRIRPTLKEDLYLVYAGDDGEDAVIQAYVNPLVFWVWLGGILMVVGTLIAMLPDRARPESPGPPKSQSGCMATKGSGRSGFTLSQGGGVKAIPPARVSAFLLFFILSAGPLLAESAVKTSLTDPTAIRIFQEVSRELTCQCGCFMNLAVCNHIDCPWAVPARLEIEGGIQKGYRRDEILQQFLARYGTRVRASPPAGGFHLFYWGIPFVFLSAGGIFIGWFLRKVSKSRKVKRGNKISIDRKLEKEIEEELEKY